MTRLHTAFSALLAPCRKFVNCCAELGPFNAFLWGINRHFLHRGKRSPLIRYYFVAQPVHDAPVLCGRRGRSIEVRRLAPGDPAFAALPLAEDVLDFRFGQGALCFGAFKNGQILGCLWLCRSRYDEDEVRCSFLLQPDGRAAWDFDVYVMPAARGGLTFVRLWDEANAYLRGLGIAWSVSRISAFNPESLAAHRRLGARRISSALFLRIGDMQLLLSGVRPFLSLSTSTRRAPEIALCVTKRISGS